MTPWLRRRAAATAGPPAPGRAARWAMGGSLLGAAVVLVAFAPAAWLAQALASATGGRLLLADARGTLWAGSAVPVLTGGPGSRDASALPGRLHWTLRPAGAGLDLRAHQDCCINGELSLQLRPGWGRWLVRLPDPSETTARPAPAAGAAPRTLAQWPASWLAGLGTPWNTLQPTGSLRLSSTGMSIESVQGRWRFEGRVELALDNMASRVSMLDTLGSYQLVFTSTAPVSAASWPEPAKAADTTASLELSTREGALRLSGRGQFVGERLRFTGQASAAPGSEAVLNNLLNIIGRRQGALSVISIG